MNLGTVFPLQYTTWTILLFFFLSFPIPEMAYFLLLLFLFVAKFQN